MKYLNLFNCFAAVGMALMAAGCSDNPDYIIDGDGKTGKVDLNALTANVEADEVEISRADTDINLDPFLVSITDADGKEVYASTYAERNEIITLPVATGYTVSVRSHEPENAAWSAPLYEGSKQFDIEDGKITAIGLVTCKFANIRVSVRYTDQLKNLMGSDCKVEVNCSENGASLTYVPSETRSGYFKALEGSTTLGAHFTGTVNGQQVSMVRALNNVEAGQHRIITFAVRTGDQTVPDEFGSIGVTGEGQGQQIGDGLWLDMSVTTEDVNGNVVVDDPADSGAERPGEHEGGDDPNPPTPITDPIRVPQEESGPKLNEVNIVERDAQYDGVVMMYADKGFANLQVEIETDSDNFKEALEGVAMPTLFDLAHTKDASEREIMTGFGFPVDEQIIGQTKVKFDISQFIPLLAGFPGNHKFILTITDAEGNTKTVTLAFQAV